MRKIWKTKEEKEKITRLPSEKSSKSKESEINPTLARGIIGMMFLLLAFQAVTFTIHKCSGSPDGPSPESRRPAAAYSTSKSAAASNNNSGMHSSNGKYGSGRGK